MTSPLRADASLKEQLDWYRTEYALLEADLADYKGSSKELEEQLEKDVENLEKNERKWKEQIEKLNFQVEEWKTKHKQAKAEANTAQNALQKEVTAMRESTRSLQLRLRDTEVINDDYERQARNTESSLEDLESKYSTAIERGVLLEIEIKLSEQDREALRIETQRLRDELGDLKVESDITLEKLRLAEGTIEGLRTRKPSIHAVEHLRTRSPGSEASGFTPLSSTASTPPPKSEIGSEVQTPPSPPLSDAPINGTSEHRTPVLFGKKSLLGDSNTLRPSLHGPRVQRQHLRGASIASSTGTAASGAKAIKAPPSRTKPTRTSNAQPDGLPRSESLYQIRGLIGRMQKIEERVHSARSKLPAPGNTTPKGSPRTPSGLNGDIPSSITVRRTSKRPSGSTTSSAVQDSDATSATGSLARRESRVKRLSYGIPRPSSVAASRSDMPDQPPSSMDGPSATAGASRPSSRASMAAPMRPESRSGARTSELGHYSSTTASHRSRSSMGGNYATMHSTPRSHRQSASVSELRRKGDDGDVPALNTPSRRTTIDKSALPTPTGLRRQSGGMPQAAAKQLGPRASTSFAKGIGQEGDGQMRPPPRKRVTDVGETY